MEVGTNASPDKVNTSWGFKVNDYGTFFSNVNLCALSIKLQKRENVENSFNGFYIGFICGIFPLFLKKSFHVPKYQIYQL